MSTMPVLSHKRETSFLILRGVPEAMQPAWFLEPIATVYFKSTDQH